MQNTNKLKQRFFPQGAIKVYPKGTDIEIGLYTSEIAGKQWVGFIAYSGKKTKHDAYYRYSTLAKRDEGIARYLDLAKKDAESKERIKNNKVLSTNPVKVGDIFYSSWGYDQTNVDFYQVVAVKGTFVEIREIACEYQATGDMTGNVSPRKDVFLEKAEVIRKKVLTYNNGETIYLNMSSYANAQPYDNRPKYSSSYA